MKIGIIGLGLIGGSLGRALVKRTAHTVYGADSDSDTMKKGELLGAFHKVLEANEMSDLDMLILALPPHVISDAIKDYVAKLKNGCIVIDCVGNKREAVKTMTELSADFPDIAFVGGHPMAGREFSGIRHSTPSLFDGASMIIVPVTKDMTVLSKVKETFLGIGFKKIVITTAEEHDRIISYTSQLAHIVSSAYVQSPTATSYLGFSAGSFKDMTRVAKMNPEMWTHLFSSNSDNLLAELEYFINNLIEFRALIESSDLDGLRRKLEKGNNTRLDLDKIKN